MREDVGDRGCFIYTLACSVISIRPTRVTMLLGRWGEWLNSARYNLRKVTAVQVDSILSKLKANHKSVGFRQDRS